MTAGPVVPVERQRLALQPILDGSVEIRGGFWGERQRRNREVTIPYGMKMLEESGTIENFRDRGRKLERPSTSCRSSATPTSTRCSRRSAGSEPMAAIPSRSGFSPRASS